MQKITVLAMMLFLTSTILIATKTNVSFSSPSGDGEIAATSEPLVYVDPENVMKNVSETFTIDVVIADIADLYGVDIQFKWDPLILEYVSHTAKIPVEDYPDGILHEPGITILDTADPVAGTYELAFACMDPAPVFDGTGIAFNITFTVIEEGGCFLEFPKNPTTGLPLIELSNKAGLPISYDSQDGRFETPGIPTAIFAWKPTIGVVGKPTIFNASESFAHDGTIVKYYWDFDDGNLINSTSAEITHVFNHSIFTKIYSVSLIVEDNATVKSAPFVRTVTIVKSRNIEITSITLSSYKKQVNSTISVNALVTNNGYTNENFTLAAYYNTSATNWAKIDTEDVVNLGGGDETLYFFIWNTTGVEADKYYVIKVNSTVVPYEDETDNTKISEPAYITLEAIHDLAVTTLLLQATLGGDKFALPVIFGENALFTMSIENDGSVLEESYYVVVYSNGSSLNEWNITDALDAGAKKTLTYTWNSIPQHGLYNITVQVTVTDDNNTQNNQLQQMMRVIGKPILNITFTPETLVVNQETVLNASDSVHGDPNGQLTSYYWAIYAPGQELEEIPEYRSAESEISVSYTFTETGNWTIVLRVVDSYGITYIGTRDQTAAYRLTEMISVQGGGWGLVEYIVVIIVVIVIAIAAFILIRRRRSGLTHTE